MRGPLSTIFSPQQSLNNTVGWMILPMEGKAISTLSTHVIATNAWPLSVSPSPSKGQYPFYFASFYPKRVITYPCPITPPPPPPHKNCNCACDQQRNESLDDTCEGDSYYLAYTTNSSDPKAGLLDYTNLPDIYNAGGVNVSREDFKNDNLGRNFCDDPCQPTSGGDTCSALVCLEVKSTKK